MWQDGREHGMANKIENKAWLHDIKNMAIVAKLRRC